MTWALCGRRRQAPWTPTGPIVHHLPPLLPQWAAFGEALCRLSQQAGVGSCSFLHFARWGRSGWIKDQGPVSQAAPRESSLRAVSLRVYCPFAGFAFYPSPRGVLLYHRSAQLHEQYASQLSPPQLDSFCLQQSLGRAAFLLFTPVPVRSSCLLRSSPSRLNKPCRCISLARSRPGGAG